MFKTLLADRPLIEQKYHKPGAPYDPYRRFDFVGWEPENGTGLSDEAMQDGLKALSEAQKDLHHAVSKANAFRFVCENSVIDLDEHDYFVYFHAWRRPLRKSHFQKWVNASNEKRPETAAWMADLNASGAVGIWADYDHVIPDWDDLLALGFRGIADRARNYRDLHAQNGTLTDEMAGFFDGVIIEYQAILDLLDRYIRYGRQHPNAKSEKVVTCLTHLRDGAPGDTYEALQAMYIFFIACECIDQFQTRSLGNGFDQSLYPFYRRDLDSGRYSKDEIGEFIGYFFLQFAAIDNYWGHPMYLGGSDINGETKYNDLSLLCLDVYEALGIHNPKLQLKINLKTPEEILRKALGMVRAHNASIVFSCEPGMVRAMSVYGVPFEEAYDYEISGCYETRVKYNEASPTSGYVNILKALRYVFTNGFDEQIQKQVGIATGELAGIRTFADFHKAFLAQLGHLIDTSIELTNDFEQDLAWVNPSNLYSGTIEGALKKGADAYSVGVKYCNCAMLCCGIATAVDGAMAVKEFVFDKQEITLPELAKALEQNWDGYEELRAKIKKSRMKYGNGVESVDRYANEVARFFTTTVNNRKNARGGVYKAILHSAMMFVWQGEKTGATPDGRKRGEEISKNASPAPGMDREGVTALIRSATALEPYNWPESFCLDVMLHPSSVEGEDGLRAMKTLLMTYLKKGGQSIQFNVFDVDTLKDAQLHPEKYENLQVRVCGWNVLWNNIPKVQQDAFILRAQNIRQ